MILDQAADLQRRNVAVLFADICGFTRLVEAYEPEAVYGVVHPLLDNLVRCVHQHHGEIQQVLGDGFMAVFGLRRVHGDETERALAAGRSMLRGQSAGGLAIHLGVESGQVLVTRSWQPACFGVWGHAVNLAQRLCDLAGPGELIVGPTAFAQAGHRIGSAPGALVPLQGITAPVATHRITTDTDAPWPVPAARSSA